MPLLNEFAGSVREHFVPPIWRLGIQNPVSVFGPIVFCKPRCPPSLVKAVVVVDFSDQMESVDVVFLVCGVYPFNGSTSVHTPTPLVGLRGESRFARFTHGALIVLVIYINNCSYSFNFNNSFLCFPSISESIKMGGNSLPLTAESVPCDSEATKQSNKKWVNTLPFNCL